MGSWELVCVKIKNELFHSFAIFPLSSDAIALAMLAIESPNLDATVSTDNISILATTLASV